MRARWVITGAGMVSAGGDTPLDLGRAVASGVPLIRSIPAERWGGKDPDHALLAAPIGGFDPKNYVQRRGIRDLSRTSQLACAAAGSLAGSLTGIPPEDVGVALGSAWGSMESVVEYESQSPSHGGRLVDPLLFAETVSNVPAGHISVFFGWSAFNVTVSSGACSGLEAIREALDLLDEDRAALAIAGGADELNLPILRTLGAGGPDASPSRARPYSRGRLGPAGGEGGCLLLLEALDHAVARGAEPMAGVRAAVGGFVPLEGAPGLSSATAIRTLIEDLLERASLRPEEVGLIVAAASGEEAGDAEEAEALAEIFGTGPEAPPVLAPKGILGETWGASGPFSVLAATQVMDRGVIPSWPGDFDPDPALPRLNWPRQPLKHDVGHAVVLARAAGGHLSALLLSAMGSFDGS